MEQTHGCFLSCLLLCFCTKTEFACVFMKKRLSLDTSITTSWLGFALVHTTRWKMEEVYSFSLNSEASLKCARFLEGAKANFRGFFLDAPRA